eukprot:TRINITY_DN2569_c0_g1_i2.p1 TRINITY_DN2569_c0_g1~~TRINITY_DN2569_c0_g1_i2.p1  ORF type:complete len:334 (-),score=42.81 TRINITY_DN2569_c0_g1_i2:19-1020(-)
MGTPDSSEMFASLARAYKTARPSLAYMPEMAAMRTNAMAGAYYHLRDDQIQAFILNNDKMNATFKTEFDKRFPAKAKKATIAKVTMDAFSHANMPMGEYAQHLRNDDLPAANAPKSIEPNYSQEDADTYLEFVDAAIGELKNYYKGRPITGRYYYLDEYGEKKSLQAANGKSFEAIIKNHNSKDFRNKRKFTSGGVEKLYSQTLLKKGVAQNRILDMITEKGIGHHNFKDKTRLEITDFALLKQKSKEYANEIQTLEAAGKSSAAVAANFVKAEKELLKRRQHRAVDPVRAKKYNIAPLKASEFVAGAPPAVKTALKAHIDKALEIEKKYTGK